MNSERRIFDWLKRLDRRAITRSIGVVTNTSPLTVEMGGEEITPISKLGGYSPTLGDRVWVSHSGSDAVVHDKIT